MTQSVKSSERRVEELFRKTARVRSTKLLPLSSARTDTGLPSTRPSDQNSRSTLSHKHLRKAPSEPVIRTASSLSQGSAVSTSNLRSPTQASTSLRLPLAGHRKTNTTTSPTGLQTVSRGCKGSAGMDRKEFSWMLQKKPKEIYSSIERDLSARGVAHRADDYFQREICKYSNALSSGTGKMSRAEAFKCYFSRAFAHARVGMNQRALEDYTEAMKLMPNNGAALFNRSQVLTKLQRFDDAIADLTRAIHVDSLNAADYFHNRALLFRKLGLFQRAMEDYESAELSKEAQNKSRGTRVHKNNTPVSTSDFTEKFVTNSGGGHLGSLIRALKTPPHQRSDACISEIADLLSEINAFKSVPRALLQDLSRLAKHVSLLQDEYVFKEGDVGSDLYVVLSGCVTVRKDPAQEDKAAIDEEFHEIMFGASSWRREIVLATLHAGMTFGEIGDDEEVSSPSLKTNTFEKRIQEEEVSEQQVLEEIEQKLENEPQQEKEEEEENEADAEMLGDLRTLENSSAKESRMHRNPTMRETRKRRASIRVEEDADFLVFQTSQASSLILNKYREWQIKDRVHALRKCTIFCNWPEDGLRKLAKLAMVQQYSSGSKLISQGRTVSDLFVIRTGMCKIMKSVDVVKALENTEIGHPIRSQDYASICAEARSMADYEQKRQHGIWKEFELATLTGGQIAGEFAVLENTQKIPSPVSVEASTAVDALVIGKEDIAEVLSYFYGESMGRIRASLKVFSMSTPKINKMYAELRDWGRVKRGIVMDTIHDKPHLRLGANQEKKEKKLIMN